MVQIAQDIRSHDIHFPVPPTVAGSVFPMHLYCRRLSPAVRFQCAAGTLAGGGRWQLQDIGNQALVSSKVFSIGVINYYTVNSLLSPPGGLIDFKHSKRGLIGERGLIREGGLIYFSNMRKF